MIKLNELRKGNRFHPCKEIDGIILPETSMVWKVDEISFVGVGYVNPNHEYALFKTANHIEPIKLTDSVILCVKNSFIAAKDKTKICITAPYGFEFHFDKYGEDYVLSVYCNTGCFIPQKCEYLHDLQNLWFSICGEELVFSTEP